MMFVAGLVSWVLSEKVRNDGRSCGRSFGFPRQQLHDGNNTRDTGGRQAGDRKS